jgi:MFS family permease
MSETPPAQESAPTPERLPEGVHFAYGFVLTNAISFNITLGAPMILYAKTLGASSTVLGIIAALTPLLTIFQIPAARYIETMGYKKFMLFGWGIRIIFIFALSLVPLLGFLDTATRMALVLSSLFLFNLFRGISSGSWLPWITEIIPEAQRSRYLSMDHIFLHLGGFVAMIIGGWVLGASPASWQFSLIFVISALTGQISLYFIKRIPEADSPDAVKRSGQRVPWRTIIFYPPFLKLVMFNLLFLTCAGSLGVFTISFLKASVGLSENVVLHVSALGWLGALLTYPFIGAILDRTGSRPMLKMALGVMALILLGWCAMSAGFIPAWLGVIVFLQLSWGFAAANFNLANARLILGTMPEMGRSHFFAFFSVITSLGLAMVPILWGLALDAIGGWQMPLGTIVLTKFTIYFAGIAVLAAVTALYSGRLSEGRVGHLPRAVKEVIIEANLKRLQRMWQK